MQLFVSLNSPYRWARLNRSGEVKGSGVFSSLDEANTYRGDKLVGVVPGEEMTMHRIEIPAKSRNKLLAALPYAMEEYLTEDIDNLVFKVVDWQTGHPAIVAVMSKSSIAKWLDLTRQSNLDITDVIAEYQLLPLMEESRGSIAKTDNGTFCIKFNDTTGASIDEEAFHLWWQSNTNQTQDDQEANAGSWAISTAELANILNLTLDYKPFGQYFDQWLDNRDQDQPIQGIIKGVMRSDQSRLNKSGLVLAASMLLVSICLKLGFNGYELSQLRQQNTSLNHKIENLLTSTFPEVKNIVNARLQFSREMDSLEQGISDANHFHVLLFAAAQALRSNNARIEEADYKMPALIISVSVNNFAALDQLKQQFDKSAKVKVKLISSGSLNNRVTGRFSLERA